MNKEHIVSYSAEEIREMIARGESRTDWARVDAMTDDDIVAAMRDDPDWQDLIDIDWSQARMVIPQGKTAISIRLDDDVVDFFRTSGKGYQTRINAILRHYMDEHKRTKT